MDRLLEITNVDARRLPARAGLEVGAIMVGVLARGMVEHAALIRRDHRLGTDHRAQRRGGEVEPGGEEAGGRAQFGHPRFETVGGRGKRRELRRLGLKALCLEQADAFRDEER